MNIDTSRAGGAEAAALPAPPLSSPPTPAELIAWVAHEAFCLDTHRWDDWAALFAPDGWYWLPADTANTDPQAQASHLYDDALLRSVKLQRLQSAQAHSQKPAGRCHHLLQLSEVPVHDAAGNRYELRTPFIYSELRAGHTVTLPGVAWHRLRVHEGALRIVLKRVDLLHAAEPLPAVEFYIYGSFRASPRPAAYDANLLLQEPPGAPGSLPAGTLDAPARVAAHGFDRLHQSRTGVAPATSEEGKGLALAIVKRIAELHQGRVSVK